jgi:hypothetical protein
MYLLEGWGTIFKWTYLEEYEVLESCIGFVGFNSFLNMCLWMDENCHVFK